MKKILKIILWSILFLILGYSLCWYVLMLRISKKINADYSQKELFQNTLFQDYKIKFDNVNITGFPFKLALRINDFQEEKSTILISHQNPLIIGYDIWNQKIFIEYTGVSIAEFKNLEFGFGKKIVSNAAYSFKYPINLNFIKTLIKKNLSIDLIKNLNQLKFTTKDIKVYDLATNDLLIKSSLNKYKFKIEKWGDGNWPQKCEFLNSVNIEKAENTGLLTAPMSLIYGMIVDLELKENLKGRLDLWGKDWSNLWTILSHAKIEIDEINSDSLITKQEAKFYYYNNWNNEQDFDLKINFSGKVNPKTGYAKSKAQFFNIILMNNSFFPWANTFLKLMSYFMDKYATQIDNTKNITAEIDFSSSSSKEKPQIFLKNFTITADTIGIMLNNETKIKSNIEWDTKGQLAIYDFSKITDFLYDNFLYDSELSFHINTLVKDANKLFLRQASSIPDSNSKDLLYNYEARDKLINLKIGAINVTDLGELYYRVLYKQIEANTEFKDSKSIVKKFKEIFPSLGEHLLKNK